MLRRIVQAIQRSIATFYPYYALRQRRVGAGATATNAKVRTNILFIGIFPWKLLAAL